MGARGSAPPAGREEPWSDRRAGEHERRVGSRFAQGLQQPQARRPGSCAGNPCRGKGGTDLTRIARRRRERQARWSLRMVDAEVDHAGPRRDPRAPRPTRRRGHGLRRTAPGRRRAARAGELAVVLPGCGGRKVGRVVEGDQVLLGEEQALAQRLQEAQIAGVRELERAVDDIGRIGPRDLAVGGEAQARAAVCRRAIAYSAGLIGDDDGQADRSVRARPAISSSTWTWVPVVGPYRMRASIAADRPRGRVAPRPTRGSPRGSAVRAAGPARTGLEDQHVVGQHVGQSQLDASATEGPSSSPPTSSIALRRTYTQAPPGASIRGRSRRRGGAHGRGCRLEGLGWRFTEVVLGEGGGGGRGGARVGGIAQAVEPPRGDAAPRPEQDHVGGGGLLRMRRSWRSTSSDRDIGRGV